jgi:CheY-like chemotaxis protein
VLTTSSQEVDVDACYEQGASSFITKPVRYSDLVRMARQVKEYWLDIVKRPRHFDPS